MVWKIIGVVALVWIAVAIIGALLKGLFPLLVLAVIVGGLYLLYKAVVGSGDNTVQKL
ncbi:hypothetical protein [Nocardia asteroides]|uniref:hypothetical protein n=1 Tax=Nocardia asteroides TaxID=1824 RepID=UPI001E3ADE92|nr:hypothetical protein [Nocardia asteroides]UGT63535.1 hypothetical protein LTT61_09580 [Nocardia asteroides]